MRGPLLETKLHLPRRRRNVVARPRLTARLSHGGDAALTLVSAPAGFGKTTALSEWLAAEAERRTAVAWVSLDANDNDPQLFWAYVAAALQRVLTDSITITGDNPTTLVNELAAATCDVIVVLDDYHVIERPEINEAVEFIVENLPAHVRIVISSRADPPLPLARLRARGDLLEIRAADLRFDDEETATYLRSMVGNDLTPSDISALEARTEGWIAALQLAALSMQGRDDISEFVDGFAGDDRFVVDYLAGEVLHRQPRAVRRFLLHTCLLSRFTASLCDAVTGNDDSAAMLRTLDEGNLFVVALDDRRTWYRYHHLFADVVRLRLLREDERFVRELHRRASAWFAAHDELPEAFFHAVAAEDYQPAADVAERALPQLSRARQHATMRTWFAALPADVFDNRPVLNMGYIGARMVEGDTTDVESRLTNIEQWLDEPDGAIIVDHDEYARLPAQVAVYRAGLARMAGDGRATLAHAERALTLVGPDDHLARGGAAGLLALAYWSGGDLDVAHHWWTESITSLKQGGFFADVLGCTLALGDICIAQDRLDDALTTFENGVRHAEEHNVVLGRADMHVGLSEVYVARGDIDAATRELERSEELGPHGGLPQNAYRERAARARLQEAQGDDDGALALLDEAARLYVGDYFPEVRPIAARKARIQIRRGDLAAARRWAAERDLSPDEDLSYLREFEHVTLARLLLAEGKADAAHALLDRLLAAAAAGGRGSTVREIRELRSERRRVPAGLVDPLSERELDVLRLLRSDLSGPDIARELMVSLNTMRTHTKNIYTKLGVNNRREAVTRAAELGL